MAKSKLTSKRAKKNLSAEQQEQALQHLKVKKEKGAKSHSRVTIDFPMDIYSEMKEMVKDEGRTLKGYIINLVKYDLKNRQT